MAACFLKLLKIYVLDPCSIISKILPAPSCKQILTALTHQKHIILHVCGTVHSSIHYSKREFDLFPLLSD